MFDKKGNIKGDNVFGGALSDIGCVEGGDDYGMYGSGLHEATNTKYFNTDGLGKNTEESEKPDENSADGHSENKGGIFS